MNFPPRLTIPTGPASRDSGGGGEGGGDSPLFGSYYGGPVLTLDLQPHLKEGPDERTIRPNPPMLNVATFVPSMTTTTAGTTNSNGTVEVNKLIGEGLDEGGWSDDVLEELSRLGEGAGGAVHQVRDRRTGKIMARKTITTREGPIKQLMRELSFLSSTTHINIIHYYGMYISPSSSEVKVLMDFSKGGSLETVGKRIKEQGAVVGETISGRLAEGILQGLAYLHTKKMIHRDIKPSNILISEDGVVKLCDFGVSGELVDSLAGTFTGTSFYMAPERIQGREYTIRSDVWSTGITLLELVQNRFPFPNDLPPIELMMYITTAEPPQLEDEPGTGIHWSCAMKDFIKQTLTSDAGTRPTPKDMLGHLWIRDVMKQEVQMEKWIRQVWGWPKPSRKTERSLSRSGTGTGSRPSSRTGQIDP